MSFLGRVKKILRNKLDQIEPDINSSTQKSYISNLWMLFFGLFKMLFHNIKYLQIFLCKVM